MPPRLSSWALRLLLTSTLDGDAIHICMSYTYFPLARVLLLPVPFLHHPRALPQVRIICLVLRLLLPPRCDRATGYVFMSYAFACP